MSDSGLSWMLLRVESHTCSYCEILNDVRSDHFVTSVSAGESALNCWERKEKMTRQIDGCLYGRLALSCMVVKLIKYSGDGQSTGKLQDPETTCI